MGKITVRRKDRSSFEVRTTKKTRHVRLAHENPIEVDLSEIGETPNLTEISLNYETTLGALDLRPLAGHPALESLSAHVEGAVDLSPLAQCRALRRLSLSIGGDEVLDFAPLRGHAALAGVGIDYTGMQPALDLGFVRDLPALTSLSLGGGEWRTLDLSPLEGRALESLTLNRQYISSVDLALVAQPALEHLMLQDLEIKEGYLDLLPLARATKLRFLSLLGNEVGTLEVSGLAKLEHLRRFDPPNFKSMMMSSLFEPIVAPGLLAWKDSIGID